LAESPGDRLAEEFHRATGFERPLGGWNCRTRQTRDTRQRGVAAGGDDPLGGAKEPFGNNLIILTFELA